MLFHQVRYLDLVEELRIQKGELISDLMAAKVMQCAWPGECFLHKKNIYIYICDDKDI